MATIDLDRGVLIRKHSAANMKVFMYLDAPGIYLNTHGGEVPEAIAKIAGFDTEKYAKARYKREKMLEFQSKIEAELEAEDENEVRIVAERGGYQVIGLPLGNANVVDAQGEKMNDRPITEMMAMELLEVLAPGEAKPEKAVKPTK